MSNFSLPSLTGISTGITSTIKDKLPLLVPVREHEYALRLDNSTTEVFQTCPRSAFYYCVKRRTKVGRAPLIFGGGIHQALEHIYRTDFSDLRGAKLAALLHLEAEEYDPGSGWRTPELMIDAIEKYFNYYSLMDNIKPITINNELFVEKAFEIELGTFEINQTIPYTYRECGIPNSDRPDDKVFISTLHARWCGKMDILATLGDSSIRVIDHKTTSMGGDTFFDDFTLSQQTVGYAWAASQLAGTPVTEFLLNALMIRKPTRTGKGIEFERRSFFYPQYMQDEWKTDVLASVESFVFSMLHGSFPKYTKWCMGKYGSCQYHSVCSSPPQARDFVLSTDMFSNVSWSPLNEKEESNG